MASPDVLKSVSKKLKYYLDIQRLEDGFDLSGPDCPRMDHPPIRARSALQYSGLHDRPLKHYFHRPSVKIALTNLKTADDKNSGQEEEIRRSIVKNMSKLQFNSPSLDDEYYSYDLRAGRRLRPEICWRGTPLVRGKMPYLSGRRMLRSAPPHNVSRKETKRLLDSTCHLVLAAESGLRTEPESSEDENEEKQMQNKFKQSEQNKVNQKKGKDTPPDDRSLSRAGQKKESTLVKRNHEKQDTEQQHGQHHSSDSDKEDHRQQRRSSPETGNKQHKAVNHKAAARHHHKATESHSEQPQKTATKEQSKEQRKTTFSGDKFSSGRISIQPNRSKSAKYKSPTYDNNIEKRSSLRNPRNKRLTRSYDQFSTTVEIGTQTSGELLKHYDPSEQVLSEGTEIKYHVDVQTGKCAGAGTKAEIQIVLIGDLGRTEYLLLSEALTPHKIKFKRNQHDLFEVFCPSVGNLQQIKIGHNKKQAEYKWYVESVTVRDFARRVEYRIPCQKWLSGAFGDKETFGEFEVKSSSPFSLEDVDRMDFDPEETYVAMVRTESRISLEAENPDVVDKYPVKNSGSLSVENSRTTEMKNEDGDSSENSQSDSSSVVSEGELRIPVSPTTPQSPEKSEKPRADRNDDYFDQKVKENDYSSMIESIISNASDSENNNSTVPQCVSSGNGLSKIDDRDYENTDQSDSERSTAYLETHSALARQKETRAKVHTPPYGHERQSPTQIQSMQDAVRFGRYNVVLQLAKDHPELLEQMNDGEYAPIHVAAFYNKLEILKWLTSHMADVDLESKGGHTALQLAAINGHMDCLKVLFEMGAKINYRTSSGQTALHLATLVGKANSVKWLLENGADKTVRDSSGSTPLDLAKEFNHNEITQIISSFVTSGKKWTSKKETRKVDKNLML